ncbi:hypothetical protein ASE75_05960 [Sphingomonas sp. Leaf17]|uniref:hypothetical protein n=1 Tax=Sphingomonas sp. Leaf17 TaxID=1735683 RepID=UPI0006FB17D6|nr:hypothetical protein [Sphingomonas sp. Leaf17]KQM65774.1 hypothetical protein ASE75_05960 [Sphingomonas sp. Leaf17]
MRRAALAAAAALLLARPAVAQVAYPPAASQWVDQKTVTLDAAGNATWTFDLGNAPPVVPVVVHMPAAMDTTNPITCNYTARTMTGVSIHCWRTTLLGLLTSLYSGSVAGAQVTLVARAIP